jgi:Zn-finger protein
MLNDSFPFCPYYYCISYTGGIEDGKSKRSLSGIAEECSEYVLVDVTTP